ncbi:phage tail protein [Paenibacillus sp. 481]|uniref:phage tail protein n=1 Tax=Paenibacillus sp. 481 TaxID=2835869 RepID=UPI001E54DC86|nr:phage tail protein [Paenibacillus sp. 481]UHA73468.1 phage tail protein [Paenibacillus sp. 481]
MADRVDPYRSFRFTVQVDQITQAGFSEVSGYDASIEVIEYREGNETTTARKLPGLTKYGNITLKWGVTDSMDMYKWMEDAVNGKIARKSVTITALDETGAEKAVWTVLNAWPCKYTAPDFKGLGNDIAIESLEIAHEGMTRKK